MIRKWTIPRRRKNKKFKTKWHRRVAKQCTWIHDGKSVRQVDIDAQQYQEIFQQHQIYFDVIVDTVFSSFAGEWSKYSDTPIGKIVNRTIKQSDDQSITREDIHNRLLYIWHNGIRRYYSRKQKIPFDNYIFRMSLWELKSWLRKYSRMELVRNTPLYCKVDITDFPRLDLFFVARGTGYPIMNTLTFFERYLLYLRFNQENTDKEIGYLIGCDSAIAGQKIDNIIDRLKRGFSRQADHQDQATVLH